MEDSSLSSIDFGGRYELVRRIGEGAFGVVCQMRDRDTGEMLAVKWIERSNVDRNVRREVLNHRLLSGHCNIVPFKEAFLTSTHLGIAMGLANGGTMFGRIQRFERFSEDIARFFFQQLVCGLAWMHKHGVCHRDLKLENTLLNVHPPPPGERAPAPQLWLCDFGASRDDIASKPKTMVGTPAYIAPEVFQQDQYDGYKADCWSAGVALYTMLVGAFPFVDPDRPDNTPRMIQRIMAAQYQLPPDLPISDACRDLFSRIFVADPAARISLEGVREHPWFLSRLPRECQGDGGVLEGAQPRQSEQELGEILDAAAEFDAPEQYEEEADDTPYSEY